MKRFLQKQLLNIVFLVLILAGALTIYFLSRAESSAAVTSAGTTASPQERQTGSASATPPSTVPTATASEPARPKGVPEAVFTTHLSASDLFSAQASEDDSRFWTLTYGETPSVTATLRYTVDGGAVSSLEFAFSLPPEYDASSKSTIEQYLAESKDRVREAREEAVRALLLDLLPACDRNDVLSRASVRIWVEETLRIADEDDDYTQKSDGCTYYAYQMQREGRDILVCLFFLDS